jgi:hypothetical protein
MSLTAFASNNPLIIQLNGFLVFCHMGSFFLNLRRGPDFCDELVATSRNSTCHNAIPEN